MTYYIQINGQQAGPLTLEQLKSYQLQPATMVWRQDLPNWVKASQLPELRELLPVTPPPIHNIPASRGSAGPSSTYQVLLLVIAFFIIFETLVWAGIRLTEYRGWETTRYVSLTFSLLFNCLPILIGVFLKDKSLKIVLIILGAISLGAAIYNITTWF